MEYKVSTQNNNEVSWQVDKNIFSMIFMHIPLPPLPPSLSLSLIYF